MGDPAKSVEHANHLFVKELFLAYQGLLRECLGVSETMRQHLDDALQDLWVALLEKAAPRDVVLNPEHRLAWLSAILNRRLISILWREQRHQLVALGAGTQSPLSQPADDRDELVSLVATTFGNLPLSSRELLTLRFLEGQPPAKTAPQLLVLCQVKELGCR